MKRIICIICMLALVLGFSSFTSMDKVYAASEPAAYHDVTQAGTEINWGDTFDFKFTVFREFQNEKLHVDIYYGDSSSGNSPVASSVSTYGSSSSLMIDQTISWDTSDQAPGTYTVEYYMEYYTLYSWHTGSSKSFQVKVVSDQYGTLDPSEDGYTMNTAYTVKPDTDYLRVWTGANTNGKYLNKLEVPSQSKVTLTMTKPKTSTGDFGRVEVSVYDSSATIIAGANLGWQDKTLTDTYIYSVYLDKGTYYFNFDPAFFVSSGSIESVYSFSIKETQSSEIEPNNTLAQANNLTNGKMVDGYFGTDSFFDIEGDDYYKFDVSAGDEVKIKLSNYSIIEPAFAPIMKLRSPDGSEKSILDDMKVDVDDIGVYTFTAEMSGTYYMYLYNYSDESIPYQIGFTAKAPCADGHNWGEWEGDKASCTKDANQYRTCQTCGKKETRVVSATGHSYGDWQYSSGTCTEDGTRTKVCKNCGNKVTETVSGSTTGHSFGDWDLLEDPTCTEDGIESRECEDCGYEEERSIPATGHKWDSGKVTKEPTTSSKGVKTYTCKNCGKTKTESLPKIVINTEDLAPDGTAMGEGATAKAAEATITEAKTDKDLKGSVFNKLRVEQSKATKTSITIKWKKIKGAKKYIVFAGKSGKNYKVKKITTLKSTKTKYTLKKFNKKNLTKGTYYKFAVVALNSKGKVITSSKFAHVATLGKNKKSNPATVTVSDKVKKNKITLEVNKTFKLKGAYAASAKKFKIRKVLPMRYESTNLEVATVSAKGVIKAKNEGTCYVFAYAQNGMYKRIKVTVEG